MKVYNEERRKARVQTVNEGPELTIQSDRERSEIQHVLRKYREVGIVDHLRSVDLEFRDVTEFTDFADLMRQTSEARQAFMRLPPEVRDVFGHSAERWLAVAQDEEALEALKPRLQKLGFLPADEAPADKPADKPAE